MTVAELHEILDDENKTISFKEYQDVLYQLKNDTIAFATREEFEKQEQTPKCNFYYGETNAFQIALNLSEHINPNQKAIECLKKIIEDLNYGDYAFGTIAKQEIEDIITDKIKELEGEKE